MSDTDSGVVTASTVLDWKRCVARVIMASTGRTIGASEIRRQDPAIAATPRSEIRALTGVRGLAAFMVVLYHYFQDSSGFGLLRTVIGHSYMSVDLFFVLSGYVMALTYGSAFTGGCSVAAYGSFLGKRLGRVYPLYFVVTCIVTMLIFAGGIAGQAPSIATMVCNALMVQAWGIAPSIGGSTWSISTEFAAYLAFPALVAIVLARSAYVGWAIGVVMAALLLSLAGLDSLTLHQIMGGIPSRSGPLDIFGSGTVYPLLRCIAGFVLGLVAFQLSGGSLGGRFIGWKHAGDVAAILVLILWAVRGTDVVLELAFVALVMTLSATGSIAAVLIGSPIVFWLGEISYSIYLVHGPVESLLRDPLKTLLEAHHAPHAFTISGVVPLILTFLVSAASFYGLEKPARNWTRRLMGGYQPPISGEPAAP